MSLRTDEKVYKKIWVRSLFNLIRRMANYGLITLMDFIISMGRGKLNIIMNDNG